MNWNIDWWKAQTKNTVVADMKAWATLTDDGHRTACYTADKGLWPVDCSIYNGNAKNLPKYCLYFLEYVDAKYNLIKEYYFFNHSIKSL
jgi:hypothetical protein